MDELTATGRGSRVEMEEVIVMTDSAGSAEKADPKKPKEPGKGDEAQPEDPNIPWQGGPDDPNNPDIPWQGEPNKS